MGMFLYLGFTMKSSKKASRLLSGGSIALEYDILWSGEAEAAESSEEADSVGSTQDEDEGTPPFSYRNDLEDFDDTYDDGMMLNNSHDSPVSLTNSTPPFTYRE